MCVIWYRGLDTMAVTVKDLFPINSEDVAEVRAVYNKSEEDINSDIEIIRSWLKKQPHLPQDHDDGRLERFFIRNKCRLEQTKTKLDKYFSLRGSYPEYFDDILNLELPYFSNINAAMFLAPMPVLTPKKERVLIFKLTGEKSEEFSFKDQMSMFLMLLDLQISHDYTVGERLVSDLSHFGFNHLKKFTPSALEVAVNLHQEAFSGRLTGIHHINAPAIVNSLLSILKQVFSKKLYSKIHVHDNLESLYEFIPREMLPKDYGGDQRPLMEIHDDFCTVIKNEKAFLLEHARKVANEKLRVGRVIENDQFGMEGTFKNLRLD